MLHLVGFTDHGLRPEHEHQLLAYGCGITSEIWSAATLFEAMIRHYSPNTVTFLGMRAVHAMLPSDDLRWGLRRLRTADVPIWLLLDPAVDLR